MEDFYNNHYIRIREDGCIIDGFSDAFREPTEDAICINDQGGYQFRLFPGGEENPPLYEFEHMVPLYKWEGGEVVRRTEEEIDADIVSLPAPVELPSQLDQIEAQVTYTAMMTDTLMEV